MSEEIKEAIAESEEKSYEGQETSEVLFKNLDSIEVNEYGVHFLGLAVEEDRLLAMNYYGPALGSVRVIHKSEIPVICIDGNWIRGLADSHYRIFPDLVKNTSENRGQIALFGPNDYLLISRDTRRNLFWLSLRDEAEEAWQIEADKTISLPLLPGRCHFPLLINACLELNALHASDDREFHGLYTVEASGNLEKWALKRYILTESEEGSVKVTQTMFLRSIAPWMHGVTKHNDSLWFITDYPAEAKGTPIGVYRCDLNGSNFEIVYKDPAVWGSGLAFLPDGSLLIGRYGESYPSFFGKPGALIRIPAKYLQ